jgi:hypothetical protein
MELKSIKKDVQHNIVAVVLGDSGTTYAVTGKARHGNGEVINDWNWSCNCKATQFGDKWCKHKKIVENACYEKRWMTPF